MRQLLTDLRAALWASLIIVAVLLLILAVLVLWHGYAGLQDWLHPF